MTLRASKRKLNPALGLLNSTLIKNMGIIVLMSIAMIILCPGFFLAVLSKTKFRAEYYSTPGALDAMYGITAVFSCILVCIGNYVNFSYLYKKHSSDVFHALPLTRNSLMLSRAAASFIGVLIPVTIGYVSLAFLTIPYPTYAVGTLSQIASAYLVNVLLMIAASAFSLFFIICAGSAFDLALSFAGFNAAVLAVAAIIINLCDSNLSGYNNSDISLYRAFSPIFYLGECGYLFADKNYALSLSISEIFGIIEFSAIFTVINVLLYNFRKAERGEQAYAYKFIYVVCSVLAGFCGGYALSRIFIFGADAQEFGIIGIVSFIVGALITTAVYGAVSERGFKNFKKSLLTGAISVLVYGIAVLIVLTGAFGFEKRIPTADKITAATVDFDEITVDFTDPADVIALHKAVIEKDADDEYDDIVDSPHTYLRIDYNLSGKGNTGNGDFLREYYVDKNKIKKELFKVYSSENRFAAMKNALDSTNSKWEIWGSYNGDDEYVSLDGRITPADTKKLIDVYRKELNAVGENYFTADNQENMLYEASFMWEYGSTGCYSFHIFTTSDFPETNNILSAFKDNSEDTAEKQGL